MVVQGRQGIVLKSMLRVQNCCFAHEGKLLRDGSLEKCWEGGGGGGGVVILRHARLMQDFFFEHVIKVEIFFFPSKGIHFFGQNP